MSIKTPPTDLPIISFASADDFEAFLDREHELSPGIWLKVAKKSAGIPSVTFEQALDVALCFGWINGQGLPFDEQWHLSRYTPRRPQSLWSKRNVDKIATLEEAGRMRPAGSAAVEAAKADGRWERAYAGPASIEVPDDLASALGKNDAAAAVFQGLNKTRRYSVLWRIETASPQNRAKKVATLVKDLADGKPPERPDPAPKAKRQPSEGRSKARAAARTQTKTRKPAATLPSLPVDQAEPPRRAGLRPRP